MRLLQHRSDQSELHVVQPGLQVLRSEADPAIGPLTNPSLAMFSAQNRRAERLAAIRARRGGDTRFGQGRPCNWPGKRLGVRCPGIDETPLSEEEVVVALRLGLL
jgi:hypothetical protein